MEKPMHSEPQLEHSIQKADVNAIEVQQNEKAFTDTPAESVVPAAEHVTAKTWVVIFVSLP